MKMVGSPSRSAGLGAVVILVLMATVTRTCAATTSLKPELTESTNGTTIYEATSQSSPLDTSDATEEDTFSTTLDTTSSVLLASLTSHADATTIAATRLPPPTTVAPTTPQAGAGGGVEAGSEEYYSSYDYPETAQNSKNHNQIVNSVDSNNNTINSSSNSKSDFVHKEPGVIPDPDTQDRPINLVDAPVAEAPREDVDAEADEGDSDLDEEMSLPDDSLADTDLHDHDLIDSVMYIYFGATQRAAGGAGRQVLIAGAAISLMAQFFALASAARRMRGGKDQSTRIFLATEVALTTTNLVFMLGVQATDKPAICKCVSLALHTLYLLSSCWLFVISLNVYQRLVKGKDLSLTWCLLLMWMLPATLVRLCYVVNPRGFETHRYCWMSVERGMVLSFMVPMSTLILLNTAITVYCQRMLSRTDACSKQCGFDGTDVTLRRSLLASAMLLPMFAMAWFLRVVALENDESVAVPVLAALTDAFLNWYIFLRSHVLLPYAEPVDQAAQLLFESDAQPLISPEMSPIHVISHPSGAAGAAGAASTFSELRFDAISTIST